MHREGPGGPPPGRLRLRYVALDVEVESAEVDALAWLAEFLGPCFAPVGPGDAPPAARVALEVDPGAYAALGTPPPAAPRAELEGFTYDGSFSRHAAWRDTSGWTWAPDERRDVLFGVAPDAARIRVLAPRATDHARVALLRVVRELATRDRVRAGWLPLHGAAFAAADGVTVACGPRRSGKTSLLVHALSCGATLVSNDRVFADPATGHAQGMPTIVMLRDGTLDLFPELARAYAGARYDRARTLAACAPGVDRPTPSVPEGADRPGISPVQLAALLGAPQAAGGPLRRILLPEIDPAARGIALERVPPEAALAPLLGALIRPSRPSRTTGLFAPSGEARTVPEELERTRAGRLLAHTPAWRVLLGPDAWSGNLVARLAEPA